MQRLKLEVLKFLGELGGQDNQYVVRTDRRDISTLAVSWSTKEHIKFVMPFKDTKTDIYLGKQSTCFLACSPMDKNITVSLNAVCRLS